MHCSKTHFLYSFLFVKVLSEIIHFRFLISSLIYIRYCLVIGKNLNTRAYQWRMFNVCQQSENSQNLLEIAIHIAIVMEIKFLQFFCPVKRTSLLTHKLYPFKAVFLKEFKEILPLFILYFHMEIKFLFNLLYMELYSWYIA